MKKVLGVYSAPGPHWVGDAFPVRSLFTYDSLGKRLSPFLLLDYAGPAKFAPAAQPRGVGQHPHRGFETVTLVYEGEVQHRDSSGAGGVIGPGDVQWMTAGAGILHEEFHSEAFTRKGGTLEMVQLWVNLRARDKMVKPGYQGILDRDIPVVNLADGAGRVRIIAGRFLGRSGPAHTFSPLDVWDVRLNAGKRAAFSVAQGRTIAVVVLHGAVQLDDGQVLRDAQMAVLEPAGEDFSVKADSDAVLLVLSGEPLDEPIAGYGPFVMNTQEQISEAIDDFNRGRFGQVPQQPAIRQARPGAS
jgi:redox-sensitive bicupin YhaK (pirin superfamily)